MPDKKAPNPIDVHVGARVRLRRTMLGISQEKLGREIGLTFQQVQKYEKGINRIGASRMVQICRALSAQPAWFFEGAPDMGDLPAVSDPLAGLTAPAIAIARDISRLRPDQVRSIADIVSQIVGASGAAALSDAA